MHALTGLIEQRKQKLDGNLLSVHLTDKNIALSDKLRCIPLLSFFVLGFKDCMQLLQTANPQNELERMINTHSAEDSFHWQWFLADLDRLNIDDIQNKRATAVMEELWSDGRMPIRSMVYKTTYYIQKYEDPAMRLLLIEVIESGYAAFTRYMSPVMLQAGLYEKLAYFGHTHNEAEAEHEMYHDSEDIDIAAIEQQLSTEQKREASVMIHELYDGLEDMHHCFALAIQSNKDVQ